MRLAAPDSIRGFSSFQVSGTRRPQRKLLDHLADLTVIPVVRGCMRWAHTGFSLPPIPLVRDVHVFWRNRLNAKFRFSICLLLAAFSGCASTHVASPGSLQAIDSNIEAAASTAPKSSNQGEAKPLANQASHSTESGLHTAEAEQAEPGHIAHGDESLGLTLSDQRPDQIDVESLVAMAMKSNPAIQQAQAAMSKARGIYHQVGLKPNPMVGYFAQEMGNDNSGGQHGAFVSQTFVRGDKLSRNRDVFSSDIARQQWLLVTQQRRVETDVRIHFFKALTAQRKLRQAKEFREGAERASAIAQKRLEAEEGTRADVLQSQILVDEVDLSILSAQLEWEAAWGELAAVVGTQGLQPSALDGEFARSEPIDAESLFQQITAESPLLNSARSRIDRARSNLHRQRQQTTPNLSAQFGAGYDDATGDAFASMQFGMPVPLRNKNQGNIYAVQAECNAAVSDLQRQEAQIRRDIADVIRRHSTASAKVEKYESSIVPKAEQALDLVQQAYAAGEVEFLRVLTARQTYFNLMQQLIMARGDLAQAGVEIDGLLLKDSLSTNVSYEGDDGLRGQALSGQ